MPGSALHYRIPSIAIGLTAVLSALLLSACGSGPIPGASSQPTSASSAGTTTSSGCSSNAPSSVTVEATDSLKFIPATVCLKVGGTITWKNTGNIAHTTTDNPSLAAVSSDSELPSGATAWNHPLPAGSSWSLKLTVPGTYKYFCIPHETLGMLGAITVVS